MLMSAVGSQIVAHTQMETGDGNKFVREWAKELG